MDGGRLAPARRLSASRPMAEVGAEPSNPIGPVRRQFGDAAALARTARPPAGVADPCRRGGATISSGKTEIVVKGKLRRRLRFGGGRSLGVRGARSQLEGNSDGRAKKREIAGRRRQAFDFVGNGQGKCLEFLGKSLEKFGISLEKLGFSLERLGKIWSPSTRQARRNMAGHDGCFNYFYNTLNMPTLGVLHGGRRSGTRQARSRGAAVFQAATQRSATPSVPAGSNARKTQRDAFTARSASIRCGGCAPAPDRRFPCRSAGIRRSRRRRGDRARCPWRPDTAPPRSRAPPTIPSST